MPAPHFAPHFYFFTTKQHFPRGGGRSIFLHKKAAQRAAFGKEKMPSVSPQNGAKSVIEGGGGSLFVAGQRVAIYAEGVHAL